MSNIIDAILNLVKYRNNSILGDSSGRNRANNSGDGLEEFIKDLFAGTFDLDGVERLKKHQRIFSYLGNNSNPPDVMLRDGDAIEIKKIENSLASIALNSSYPKNKLLSTSPMINKACREAESWKEKDMIYAVGYVQGNFLKQLTFVYGMDYCASESCYLRIKDTIKESVENIPSIKFSESKELGHINKVDPLGITYMRVRGMWGIENPRKVFSYVYLPEGNPNFSFLCIINEEKWKTLSNVAELLRLIEDCRELDISDILIKDPDNPAKLREAKRITFAY